MSGKSRFSIFMGTPAGLVLLGLKGRLSLRATHRGSGVAAQLETSRRAADEATRRYLMYLITPVWSIAGFLDWLWHRQTEIETTSGVKESLMHLMMAEAGAPILTGLFLETNAGALALMSAGWLLHEVTVAWDVTYTASRRVIYPREQSTHGYMQTIPFGIVATLASLHPEQALGLIGLRPDKPDFKLRCRKAVPLKAVYRNHRMHGAGVGAAPRRGTMALLSCAAKWPRWKRCSRLRERALCSLAQ